MPFISKEGQPIPNTNLATLTEGVIKSHETKELFGKGRHIIFALPGAFTPTCSATHLPNYEHYSYTFFRRFGVSSVSCISVNDPFVMSVWAEEQKSYNVSLYSDGNAEFAKAMGMDVDDSHLYFGTRSWRYSMLVEDGIIKKMFIEPEKPGDPFEVSDAKTMFDYLQENYKEETKANHVVEPKKLLIIAGKTCSVCHELFNEMWRYEHLGLDDYEIVYVGEEISQLALAAIAQPPTTPQIFVDGLHIGGYDQFNVYVDALESRLTKEGVLA